VRLPFLGVFTGTFRSNDSNGKHYPSHRNRMLLVSAKWPVDASKFSSHPPSTPHNARLEAEPTQHSAKRAGWTDMDWRRRAPWWAEQQAVELRQMSVADRLPRTGGLDGVFSVSSHTSTRSHT